LPGPGWTATTPAPAAQPRPDARPVTINPEDWPVIAQASSSHLERHPRRHYRVRVALPNEVGEHRLGFIGTLTESDVIRGFIVTSHIPRRALGRSLMDAKTFSLVAGVVFAVVSLFHLVRIFAEWMLIIGDWSVPKWVSWVAFIVAGVLALLGLRLGQRG